MNKSSRRCLTSVLALSAGLAWGALGVPGAQAADLGGDCCADLEERVAELEATTVRKGTRVMSVTLSGTINTSVLAWDDGWESNAYVVDNINDQTNFQMEGEADFAPGWTSGFLLLIYANTPEASDGVNQLTDGGGDGAPGVHEAYWFVEQEQLGRVSVGRVVNALDGVPEQDVSGSAVVGYSGMEDIGGGFFLRRSDIPDQAGLLVSGGAIAAGADASVTWGDLVNHLNGDPFNIIRYDSPEFFGTTFSASWGEDDQWAVSLAYELSMNSIEVAAAIGYGEDVDTEPDGVVFAAADDTNNQTLAGSLSMLHKPSGLNLTFAAGKQSYDNQFIANDGVLRSPDDAHYWYIKGGWLARLNTLGDTAFYAEFGQFNDFLLNSTDAATVTGLNINQAAACGGAGVGCLVSGSQADVWGLGVVQYIDAAAMELYLSYRNFDASVDLVDINLAPAQTGPLDDLSIVMAGGKVVF